MDDREVRLKIISLVEKIKDHYVAIQAIRQEDREIWRSLNKRLQSLETMKSERGKKKKVKKVRLKQEKNDEEKLDKTPPTNE